MIKTHISVLMKKKIKIIEKKKYGDFEGLTFLF